MPVEEAIPARREGSTFVSEGMDRRRIGLRRRCGTRLLTATLVAGLSALGATTTLVLVSSTAVSASSGSGGISGDKATVAQLEQRITDQGQLVQTLVTAYDKVEGRLLSIEHQMHANHGRLVADQHAQTEASTQLRQGAIAAYIDASTGNSTLPTLSDSGTLSEQEVYLSVASGSLDTAISTLQDDEVRTATVESSLRVEQTQTTITLQQLSSARTDAQAAIASDEATLAHVDGNLLALVAAANERRQRAEDARTEEALAAAAQQRAAAALTAAAPEAPAPVTSTPGVYVDPLRAINGLRPNRIDMGVDFDGYGPIYAVGDGVVLSTVVGGWPGGTFISYRLTDGPAAGHVVYAAEDIYPSVSIGQSVTSNTVLGQMYEGPTGIETGWADALGEGTTLAADSGQFYGSNSTAYGTNFSRFLQSLGGPGGMLQNDPPTGSLPIGWPQW